MVVSARISIGANQVEWESVRDENTQNSNAGNGGDLVKHTVYLSTVRFLITREPWKREIRIRECHAGRGLYRLAPEHQWRKLLLCLFRDAGKHSNSVLLRDAQRAALQALGCWPDAPEQLEWYAGSAVTNAFALAQTGEGARSLDLYEKQPGTREVLRSVLHKTEAAQSIRLSVLPPNENEKEFDGVRHVEENMPAWNRGDVVLLDPFKMKDQNERDSYGRVVDALIRRAADSPLLVLFWAWGRDNIGAEADLSGSGEIIRNGYQDLLGRLITSRMQVVLVQWTWGFRFAMWLVVPAEHAVSLRDAIEANCNSLSDHLRRNGQRWTHAKVAVTIV